jgi:hypothetical protein
MSLDFCIVSDLQVVRTVDSLRAYIFTEAKDVRQRSYPVISEIVPGVMDVIKPAGLLDGASEP